MVVIFVQCAMSVLDAGVSYVDRCAEGALPRRGQQGRVASDHSIEGGVQGYLRISEILTG